MNRICIALLIFGQALALAAWANVPMINESGSSAHMHLDEHNHDTDHSPQDNALADHEHEHDEGRHLHLSVQLNNTLSLNFLGTSKPQQNTYLQPYTGRASTGPPTPPPTL